jgi:CO/xanthine dehydrogenase Mo-binding subunit
MSKAKRRAQQQRRRDYVLGRGVPKGWYPFGYHVDQSDVHLELSADEGDDGLPNWERPR